MEFITNYAGISDSLDYQSNGEGFAGSRGVRGGHSEEGGEDGSEVP